MGVNFPTAPANGATTTVGNITYVYNSAKGAWLPQPRYPVAEPMNYILNPAFQIGQENGVNFVTTSGGAMADNWFVQGTPAFSTNAYGMRATNAASPRPPNGSAYGGQINSQANIASAAATDYYAIYQYLEGQWVQHFFGGGAQAKQMVLRFWVKHSVAGNYGGALRTQTGTVRTFPFIYTISGGQVETWVKQEFVIPGDTVGTWPKDNTFAAILWFTFFAGSNWQAAPGSWVASSAIAPTGINTAWTAGARFQLNDVGLYRDSNLTGRAPPWEAPSMVLSQRQGARYWYKGLRGNGASNTATLAGRCGMPHPVAMRIAPAQSAVSSPMVMDGGSARVISSLAATGNAFVSEANHTVASGMTVGRAALVDETYAGSGIYIAMSAR